MSETEDQSTPTAAEARRRFSIVESYRGHSVEAVKYQKQFDRMIAEVARVAAEKALTDAADFISTPGVLWHGDDGVTVYADGAYGGNRMKLIDWLRARADALATPEQNGESRG